MRTRQVSVLILLAILTTFGQVGSAQRPDSPVSVIVVFQRSAALDGYGPSYQADDRAANDPSGWNYLNRGVAGYVQSLERRHGFRADHVYGAAVRGFAARLSPRQIADLNNNPDVAFIEPDGIAYIVQRGAAPPSRGGGGGGGGSVQQLPSGVNKVDADLSSTLAGNGSGVVNGVTVYVIDTGVDQSHPDLNVIAHVNPSGANGKNADCDGHGTHVAGTIAARDNTSDVVGVAPGARIVGVKVLGCSGSGTMSGVVKGVDWVTANAVKPAVANMSLGGGVSDALDTAILNSVASGVFYAIAAGNDGADACTTSPARVGPTAGIITTAATNDTDVETSWSNYGACVDLWAPGSSILSTKLGGGTTTMSGTSMATPHVTGAAALYLANNPLASPADVESAIRAAAFTPGTTSKNGAAIQRLDVRIF